MRSRVLFLFALVAMTFFIATPVQATIWSFEFMHDGAQAGNVTPGTGFGTATYDDGDGVSPNFSWDITYQDLIGTPTAAHFHGPADFGEGAGIQVGTGIGDGSSIAGSATISVVQAGQLLDEMWYHNIHSTFDTGGEIRGQVLLIPEPASVGLLAIGLIALLGATWTRKKI